MTKGWNLHFLGLRPAMVGRMAPLRPIDDKVGERLEADADVRRVFEDFRALPLFLANTRARKHSTIFADEPR